jgi:hypothetical protein
VYLWEKIVKKYLKMLKERTMEKSKMMKIDSVAMKWLRYIRKEIKSIEVDEKEFGKGIKNFTLENEKFFDSIFLKKCLENLSQIFRQSHSLIMSLLRIKESEQKITIDHVYDVEGTSGMIQKLSKELDSFADHALSLKEELDELSEQSSSSNDWLPPSSSLSGFQSSQDQGSIKSTDTLNEKAHSDCFSGKI